MEKDINWFQSWFDSPYYHILYKHRDEVEAQRFIDNLLGFLSPAPDASFLDMACGKGRHSLYLNSKGFDVTGIDLSPNSIEYASRFENPGLCFYVQDMRRVFRTNYFNYVLNLFTSFGYFDTDLDNYHVVESASRALKPGGRLVIDFMNVKKVIAHLKESEQQTVDGVAFCINRRFEEGFIIKDISFADQGKDLRFQELVKAVDLDDFKRYFSRCGLELERLFGDYDLHEFDPVRSDRLILIAKKMATAL